MSILSSPPTVRSPKVPATSFVHNEAVTREVVNAGAGAARGSGGSTSADVLSFIATGLGFPKDFFNVIAQSGGNRATALVAAEPFTKVIEDNQADFEFLLHQLAKAEWERNGLEYDEDDIEFMFPSVTKDTTSEAVKNITIGESQGYISRETAGSMYAQEMGITTYEYEEQQQQLKDEQARGDLLGPTPAPPGRTGGDNPDDTNDGGIGDSPIHGQGKGDVEDSLNDL